MYRYLFQLTLLKSLFWIIFLVLYIVTFVKIVSSNNSTGTKIIWLIVCLIFPVIGSILYFIFGNK